LKELPLFSEWNNPNRTVVYRLADRETVSPIGGMWIAKKPAVFEVQETVTIGGEILQPGDLIYGLMYLGEGYTRGYFHGKLAEFTLDGPNHRQVVRKLSEMEATGWVQMRTGTGIVGWTDDPGYPSFDGQSESGGTAPFLAIKDAKEQEGLWDYVLEVYSDNKSASLKIGETTIPCPSQNGVQEIHTGFILHSGENDVVELLTDQGGELLAKTFIQPGNPQQRQPLDGQLAGIAPLSTGSLEITTQPSEVEVAIDGKEYGQTALDGKLVVRELAAGTHQFLFRKRGYQDLASRGDVTAGQSAVIRADLPLAVAKLTVQTFPSTEVFVDGLERGLSDAQGILTVYDLPSGPHSVTVNKPGYADGQLSVDLVPGDSKTVRVTMDRTPGYLTVHATPPGTAIDIAGLGHFDDDLTDVPCAPGNYTVVASHAGLKSESRSVSIAIGQHASFDVHLLPDLKLVQDRLAFAGAQAIGGNPRAAIQTANDMLSLDPNNLKARIVLEEAYFHLGDMPNFYASALDVLQHNGSVGAEFVHFDRPPGPQLHHTTLVVTPTEVLFKPVQDHKHCDLPPTAVPLSSIEVAEVKHRAAEQVFLHLKYRDGKNGRSHEIRLWVLGVHVQRQQVTRGSFISITDEENVIVSPGEAPATLSAVVNVLHKAMGR
jgi:hypothetical protein